MQFKFLSSRTQRIYSKSKLPVIPFVAFGECEGVRYQRWAPFGHFIKFLLTRYSKVASPASHCKTSFYKISLTRYFKVASPASYCKTSSSISLLRIFGCEFDFPSCISAYETEIPSEEKKPPSSFILEIITILPNFLLVEND